MDLTPLHHSIDERTTIDATEAVPMRILLAEEEPAWRSILDSEGLLFGFIQDLDKPPDRYRIAVVPGTASSESERQCRSVSDHGGCVIFENRHPSCPFRRQGEYSLPMRESDLSLTSNEDDAMIRIEYGTIGKGSYFCIPVSVARLWSSTSVRRMYLNIGLDETNLVHHDLVRVVKKNLRRVIMSVLQRAFGSVGFPLVRKWYWPKGNRSVFAFRGDLDGGPREVLQKFVRTANPFLESVSLFVSGEKYETRIDEISELKDAGIEIGSHNYAHIVFPDRSSNMRNVQRIHRSLDGSGIHAKGHVVPASFWANSHYDALQSCGYRYFSAFGLDHDNLPYYPCVNGRSGAVVHIPYHCMGDFLPKFGMDLDSSTSLEVILATMTERYQAGTPMSFYGHPDVVGRIGDAPSLVEAIFAEAASKSDVWMCQLADLAAWWSVRDAIDWDLHYCIDTQSVRVARNQTDESTCRLSVHLPDGSWGLLPAVAATQFYCKLQEVTTLPPLREPQFGDIGEIVHHAEARPSWRTWARKCKRETKRLLKKYMLLYSTKMG